MIKSSWFRVDRLGVYDLEFMFQSRQTRSLWFRVHDSELTD